MSAPVIAISAAQNYIHRIRNPHKREYARVVLRLILDPTLGDPEKVWVYGMTETEKRSVRIRLHELLSA